MDETKENGNPCNDMRGKAEHENIKTTLKYQKSIRGILAMKRTSFIIGYSNGLKRASRSGL